MINILLVDGLKELLEGEELVNSLYEAQSEAETLELVA